LVGVTLSEVTDGLSIVNDYVGSEVARIYYAICVSEPDILRCDKIRGFGFNFV